MKPSKRSLITSVLIFALTDVTASQSDSEDDRNPAPVLHNNLVPVVGNNPQAPQQAPVNLNEDVPGCVDDYLRCVSGCWIITEGWFDFGATLGTVATTFLGGLATLGELSSETRTALGIAAVVTGSAATAFLTLKQFASKAIIERRRRLELVIRDAHNQV